MKKLFLFLQVAALLIAGQAGAKLKLPSLIGDHMVLQRGTPAVWGWADPGEAVTVSLAGKTKTAKAGDDGKWQVALSLPKAGGPYEMTLSAGDSVTIQDVLVGEVWLGSGQSNMQFAMKTSSDADKEIPAANFPQIRLFDVERVASFKPLDNVQGSWKVCTPDTIGDFSAVAYHFGKEIHQALKVPVGLIVSCWGGTGAEAWTPRPALDKDPAFESMLNEWDHNEKQVKSWTTGDDFVLWLSDIHFIPKDSKDKPLTVLAQPRSQGLGGAWQTSAKPGCQASVTVADKAYSGQGPAVKFWGVMTGGGWGGLTADISVQNQPLDLSKYQAVEFYAKGSGQFRVSLGQASIADYDYYACADPFDLTADWKPMRFEISALKQGGWGAPKPFTVEAIQTLNFPVQVPYWPDIPAAAYNAMISPLIHYSIRGVLWYQGESNTSRAPQYQHLLSTLIASWREAWGGKPFPFLIIQLPNFMAVQPDPSESQWAELRDAQLQTSKIVPQTGLITTIDLGEAGNVHPKDKTDVGKRVALAGLGLAYHKPIVYSGPLFVLAKPKRGKLVLKFKNAGNGLVAKGGGSLTGFSLAGEDGKFLWAKAKIIGSTVMVWNDQIKSPQAVRYAWADNPVFNLYGKNGLPASPFSFSFPVKPGAKTPMDEIPPPP